MPMTAFELSCAEDLMGNPGPADRARCRKLAYVVTKAAADGNI